MEVLNKSVAPAELKLDRVNAKAMDRTQKTAHDFEAMFLSQVVEEMIKTVEIGSFGGGHAEEKWRSFLARAVADEIAGQRNTGIAQSIEAAITNYRSATNQGGKND